MELSDALTFALLESIAVIVLLALNAALNWVWDYACPMTLEVFPYHEVYSEWEWMMRNLTERINAFGEAMIESLVKPLARAISVLEYP